MGKPLGLRFIMDWVTFQCHKQPIDCYEEPYFYVDGCAQIDIDTNLMLLIILVKEVKRCLKFVKS